MKLLNSNGSAYRSYTTMLIARRQACGLPTLDEEGIT